MQLQFNRDDLRPLITEVVHEVLERAELKTGRIAYREDEAAGLLGMASHQLRDRRLEGAVQGKRVGRSWYYTRRELLELMTK